MTGGRLSAADLDGDGYPELVVSEATTHARDGHLERDWPSASTRGSVEEG